MKRTPISIDKNVLANLFFNQQMILLQVGTHNYGAGKIQGIELEDGSGFSFNLTYWQKFTNRTVKLHIDLRNQNKNQVALLTSLAA